MATHGISRGTVWILRLLDVADSVDLERARALTLERGGTRTEARMRGPEKGTGGVLLNAPPLAVDMGLLDVDGLQFRTSVRVFDFGAVSVRFAYEIAPGTAPMDLLRLAARLDRTSSFDEAARAVWNRVEAELRGAIRAGHETDLVEDYTLFEIAGVNGAANALDAVAVLEPARLLLAEPDRVIAANVVESHVSRAIRYYDDDAAIIGWNAALVLDPDGSRDELEVLEIATARLLELRYYDRLLARELARVYTSAEAARGSATFFRSPFVSVARRSATLFVEITELYDRVEGAITLVGDAYTARLYREAAERFRLDEFASAVKEKLATLARVSEVFEGDISHRRALVLEIAVVILIVMEILLSLRR